MQIILDFINQFNWIDIFVFVLFVRIFYISIRNGLPAEFFKALGTFTAVYFALHYFSALAQHITGPKKIPSAGLALFIFISIILVCYLVFVLIRILVGRLMQTEINPELSKWSGLLVGLVRTFWLSSLILFAFLVSAIPYLRKSVEKSFSGARIVRVAPATYSWCWRNIASKFMASEKFNKSIDSILAVKAVKEKK